MATESENTTVPSQAAVANASSGDTENTPMLTPEPSQSDLSSTYNKTSTHQQISANDVTATHVSPSFRGAKILVAIDVSGSTYGDILDAEKRATQAICKLIPQRLRPSIKIVPWNDQCGRPVQLQRIQSLRSDGGTDPNVFLDDTPSRDLLLDADFWFLMTDGEIDESLVRRFARGIRGYGLHGKACIICIFGEADDTPANCNISVGISVFAGSPHAAFLFSNIGTGKTYVLQTKGCFSALLSPGTAAPRLSEDTTWDDLPQTSFENLSRVHIPPSTTVSANEIVLQDDTRLDLDAFLRDLPEDETTVARILDNEENMNTIAVTAKLREETGKLRLWLDRLDKRYSESDMGGAPSLDSRSTTVCTIRAKLDVKSDSPAEGHDYADLTPIPYHPPVEYAFQPHKRTASVVHMRTLSEGGLEMASDNLLRPSPYAFSPAGSSIGPDSVESAPGFTKSARHGAQFQHGSGCIDCSKKHDTYCLLLRAVPNMVTPNLPGQFSQSIVQFPMTMGNYAETDLLVSSLVCDKCAARYVQRGLARDGEIIMGSLPLVSYSDNRTAWLSIVDSALGRRFHVSQLPMVLLGILYTKLERILSEEQHDAHVDLGNALKWAANMLLSEAVLQSSPLAAINDFGVGAIHDVLLRSFTSTRANPSFTELLQYPLDGFVVANAALSNSKHGLSFSGTKRKNVVFLKFLYHLTENFVSFHMDNDAMVTTAAKSLVLLSDEATGPSSLFKWKDIRSISMHFKDPTELRKYFTQRNSFKLSLTMSDLTTTPFLSEATVESFQRLGILFNWIISQASHATAVFVHHLFRAKTNATSVQEIFKELRNVPEILEMLNDPADVSAKTAERMIRGLPPV